MKKGVLLLGISYALLTACGTNVSLTENYFEDENFYNPTLPSPQFALESLKSNDIYSELDYDQFWDTTSQVVTSETGVNTGRSNWGGYGMSANSTVFQTNSFGWGQGLGYGVPQMFGSTWYNPWQLGPSNYWNEFMFGGYGHNSLNPYSYGFSNNGYGYNGYGYNNGYNNGNGWGNNSSTWTSNNKPRSGTNYGGRRPSKYSSSRGNSSSNGKTSNSGNASGWKGLVSPIRPAIEDSENATIGRAIIEYTSGSSAITTETSNWSLESEAIPEVKTSINESSSAGSVLKRPRSNWSGDPQTRPNAAQEWSGNSRASSTETRRTESKSSRATNTSTQSAAPSRSSSSSRSSVQSSGSRRR